MNAAAIASSGAPGVAHGSADAPTVWFDVTSPTTGATGAVIINWCDDVSLVSTSRFFTVNGTVVSVGYTPGSFEGCAVYASATVTVNLAIGSNTIYSKIRGDNFEWGEAYGAIVREAPVLGVTVTTDGGTVNKSAGVASNHAFLVTNTGNVTTDFQLAVACAGAGVVAGSCSVAPTAIQLAAGASGAATVSFTSGPAGSLGRLDIVDGTGGVLDEGWVTVAVPGAAPTPNYPVVNVSNTIAGTTVERSACLSIHLGAAAARNAATCESCIRCRRSPRSTRRERRRSSTTVRTTDRTRSSRHTSRFRPGVLVSPIR